MGELLRAVVEVLLALLAVLGLWSAGWLCYGWLLRPSGRRGRIYAVIPAQGDGGDLEMAVRQGLWLGAGTGRPCTLVIADRGLDSRGLAAADALVRRERGVVLCRPEELRDRCV